MCREAIQYTSSTACRLLRNRSTATPAREPPLAGQAANAAQATGNTDPPRPWYSYLVPRFVNDSTTPDAPVAPEPQQAPAMATEASAASPREEPQPHLIKSRKIMQCLDASQNRGLSRIRGYTVCPTLDSLFGSTRGTVVGHETTKTEEDCPVCQAITKAETDTMTTVDVEPYVQIVVSEPKKSKKKSKKKSNSKRR